MASHEERSSPPAAVTASSSDGPGHWVRRFLTTEVNGGSYVAYDSLDGARADPDAAVILSGDYGGTIYLTAPVRLVQCTQRELEVLLSDLDAITWMGGDQYDASVAYERHPVGTGVTGGDGGGIVINGVWTHPRSIDAEVAAYARQVVLGQRHRLPGPLLHQRREAAVEARRERRHRPDALEFIKKHNVTVAWDFDILPPVVPFPVAGDS